MNSSRARLDGLEALRAIMAIWVLLGHCGNYLGHYLGQTAPTWMKPLLLTSTPVEIFIVLSGFVIFELLKSTPNIGYGAYLERRARRILPIYFFAVLLALVFLESRAAGFMSAPWRTGAELASASTNLAATRDYIGWHIALHATLLHGIVPDSLLPNAAYSILAPAWSLSLEWQFYVLAPLLFVLARSLNGGGLVLLVLLLMGLAHSSQYFDSSFSPAFFLVSWPYFALGWWLSAVRSLGNRVAGLRELLFLAFGFIAIAGSALHYSFDPRFAIVSIAFSVLGISVCWGAFDGFSVARTIRRILETKLLVRIGQQSYSLYLLHVLIIDFVGWILIRLRWFSNGDAANFALLVIPTLMISLAVSRLSFRYVEQPFMASARQSAPAESVKS